LNYLFITGIAFYIAGIFLERKIDAKGFQMLTGDQTQILQEKFIKLRKNNSIANLILAAVYLVTLFTTSINQYILIIGYVVIYLAIFFVVASVYIRGLKEMNFPKEFIRNFISAKFIRVLAFGTFIATLVGAVKGAAI